MEAADNFCLGDRLTMTWFTQLAARQNSLFATLNWDDISSETETLEASIEAPNAIAHGSVAIDINATTALQHQSRLFAEPNRSTDTTTAQDNIRQQLQALEAQIFAESGDSISELGADVLHTIFQRAQDELMAPENLTTLGADLELQLQLWAQTEGMRDLDSTLLASGVADQLMTELGQQLNSPDAIETHRSLLTQIDTYFAESQPYLQLLSSYEEELSQLALTEGLYSLQHEFPELYEQVLGPVSGLERGVRESAFIAVLLRLETLSQPLSRNELGNLATTALQQLPPSETEALVLQNLAQVLERLQAVRQRREWNGLGSTLNYLFELSPRIHTGRSQNEISEQWESIDELLTDIENSALWHGRSAWIDDCRSRARSAYLSHNVDAMMEVWGELETLINEATQERMEQTLSLGSSVETITSSRWFNVTDTHGDYNAAQSVGEVLLAALNIFEAWGCGDIEARRTLNVYRAELAQALLSRDTARLEALEDQIVPWLNESYFEAVRLDGYQHAYYWENTPTGPVRYEGDDALVMSFTSLHADEVSIRDVAGLALYLALETHDERPDIHSAQTQLANGLRYAEDINFAIVGAQFREINRDIMIAYLDQVYTRDALEQGLPPHDTEHGDHAQALSSFFSRPVADAYQSFRSLEPESFIELQQRFAQLITMASLVQRMNVIWDMREVLADYNDEDIRADFDLLHAGIPASDPRWAAYRSQMRYADANFWDRHFIDIESIDRLHDFGEESLSRLNLLDGCLYYLIQAESADEISAALDQVNAQLDHITERFGSEAGYTETLPAWAEIVTEMTQGRELMQMLVETVALTVLTFGTAAVVRTVSGIGRAGLTLQTGRRVWDANRIRNLIGNALLFEGFSMSIDAAIAPERRVNVTMSLGDILGSTGLRFVESIGFFGALDLAGLPFLRRADELLILRQNAQGIVARLRLMTREAGVRLSQLGVEFASAVTENFVLERAFSSAYASMNIRSMSLEESLQAHFGSDGLFRMFALVGILRSAGMITAERPRNPQRELSETNLAPQELPNDLSPNHDYRGNRYQAEQDRQLIHEAGYNPAGLSDEALAQAVTAIQAGQLPVRMPYQGHEIFGTHYSITPSFFENLTRPQFINGVSYYPIIPHLEGQRVPLGEDHIIFTGRVFGQGSSSSVHEAVLTTETGERIPVAVKIPFHALREIHEIEASVEREASLVQNAEAAGLAGVHFYGITEVAGFPGLVTNIAHGADWNEANPHWINDTTRREMNQLFDQIEALGWQPGDFQVTLDQDGHIYLMDLEGINCVDSAFAYSRQDALNFLARRVVVGELLRLQSFQGDSMPLIDQVQHLNHEQQRDMALRLVNDHDFGFLEFHATLGTGFLDSLDLHSTVEQAVNE